MQLRLPEEHPRATTPLRDTDLLQLNQDHGGGAYEFRKVTVGELKAHTTNQPSFAVTNADGTITTPSLTATNHVITGTLTAKTNITTGMLEATNLVKAGALSLSGTGNQITDDGSGLRWNSERITSEQSLAPLLFQTTLSMVNDDILWVNEALTYSGWGQFCGNVGSFQAVKFSVRSWDATKKVSVVRTLIRESDHDGAILADKTVLIPAVTLYKPVEVVVPFGEWIKNTNIWLEFTTDGRVGMPVLVGSGGYGKTNRYTTTSNPLSTNVWSSSPSISSFAVEFGTVATDDFNRSTTNAIGLPSVDIQIPSQLYAVEGREFNLYFANVLTKERRSDFDIDVDCAKGTNLTDCFRYIPSAADAGSKQFILSAYSDGRLLAQKTSSLIVKALTAGSGVSRNLLVIGDSTTANGTFMAELENLTTGDGFGIVQVGTKTGTTTDADGDSQTYYHEGISGYKASYFLSNVSSPFVFDGAFDFATYLTTNSIAMTTNDWVMINLGLNDQFNPTTVHGATTNAVQIVADYVTMISGIKSAIPGVRIGVCVPIPPSSSQDAFGVNYAAGQERWRYFRNRAILVDKLLYQSWGANVFVVPIHAGIDTINNFPVTAEQVNARNTNTVG